MTGEPKGQYDLKVSGDPLRYPGMFMVEEDPEIKFIEMTMEQWLTWEILQDEPEEDAAAVGARWSLFFRMRLYALAL